MGLKGLTLKLFLMERVNNVLYPSVLWQRIEKWGTWGQLNPVSMLRLCLNNKFDKLAVSKEAIGLIFQFNLNYLQFNVTEF